MRDELIIPWSQEQSLVITSDNSGAIGMKDQDTVRVPYEMVGYFSFRVAVMESLASGATPISVILQNFCGDEAWHELIFGIHRGLSEIGLEHIPITGSTESNFSLSQSAIGLNVVGKRQNDSSGEDVLDKKVGLVGLPLFGEQVVTQADAIAPLSMFSEICALSGVIVRPVGSKGILHELKQMVPDWDRVPHSPELDLLKSGGPSTSFLVAYPREKEDILRDIAGEYYYEL